MSKGTLLIGVEEGKGLEDRGFVTKQNPMCQITVGKSTFKTDAARHGGSNPLWEERFVAYLDEATPTEAEIIVWSQHHIADSDEIGRGTVSLATVFNHAYQESQVSIVTQAGKHVGEVGVFFVYASQEEKTVPKNSQGQLTLKVIRALDLQETGVLKYQDPFVVIETPKTRLETAVAKGAGSDPEWKEGFELQVTPEVQDITFTIYNRNTLTDHTVIGTASYPLAQSISTGFEESRVPVTTPEGAVQGTLHIRAVFHPAYNV